MHGSRIADTGTWKTLYGRHPQDRKRFSSKVREGKTAVTHVRVVERFTRISPEKVEWTVTVDDPETWTRPWTLLLPLRRSDDYRLHEYACHEGNYAMRNILSGARADERK